MDPQAVSGTRVPKARLGMLLCAVALMVVGCIACPGEALAKGGTLSGEGTEASPYLVEDAEDLVAVSTNVNSGEAKWMEASYKLTANIDMSSIANFTPIGKSITYGGGGVHFKGTFDGNGKEIKDITINTTEEGTKTALFGVVAGKSNSEPAVIKNLTLSGNITNSAAKSYSGDYAGGIVAQAQDIEVFNCLNKANVTNVNNTYCAGIIGYILSGYTCHIDSCGNEGNISAYCSSSYSSAFVAGISSYLNAGTKDNPNYITNCYNAGTITAAGGYGAAGIVSKFSNSTGTNSAMTLSNCYNRGAILMPGISSSSSYAGNYGAITASWGSTWGSSSYAEFFKITNCYYDPSTCNQATTSESTPACVTVDIKAKTADEMKSKDFVDALNGDGGKAWMKGAEYPILSWQITPGAPLMVTDLSTDLIEYDANATEVRALSPEFKLPEAGSMGSNGTLSYQWYKTATGSTEDGVAIENATGATFTPPVNETGNFYYYVVATNTWTGDDAEQSPKSITSSVATVVVHSVYVAATPAIAAQPIALSHVGQGSEASLSVSATVEGNGAGELSYQWYVCDTNDKANARPVEKGAAATVSPDTAAVGIKYYYCKVTNTFETTKTASVDSDVVAVEVVPAEISTPAELKQLADRVNGGDNCAGYSFVLTQDIDLQSDDATKTWNPIGYDDDNDTVFAGTFDGQGHKITGMVAKSDKSLGVGLFGGAGYGATIKNFSVYGSATGNQGVGGAIGSIMGNCTVENVGADVDVMGTSKDCGGLIGLVGGASYSTEIRDCWARGTVHSTMTTSYSNTAEQGGFVGGLLAGTITIDNCYANVDQIAEGVEVGGFYGSSYYYGRYTTITNCYASGSITCLATVSGDHAKAAGSFGGAEYSGITMSNCYYDTDVNTELSAVGDSTSVSGVSGLPSSELKAKAFLTQLSFDGSFLMDNAKINDGYPILAWEYVLGTPEIVEQPQSAKIARNSDYTVHVKAEGPEDALGTLSYQWYTNTNGSADVATSTAIAGETSSEYKVPTGKADTGYNYYFCVVTNTFGGKTATAVSDAAEILLVSAIDAAVPEVASLTGDASYMPGEAAEPIKIQATLPQTGAGTLSYQWYQADTRTNDVSAATAIKGATAPEYTPEVTKSSTVYYFCEVTNTFEDVKVAKATSLPVAITGTALMISTPDDLVALSKNVNDNGVTYEGVAVELANDIDMTSVSDYEPIGTSYTAFKGDFDGKGYSIKNLKIMDCQNYSGLFGHVAGGTYRNVALDVLITGTSSRSYVGGFIGVAESASVSGVSVSGDVIAGSKVGGIIGEARYGCTISNVSNTALVEGQSTSSGSNVGGIVGSMSGTGSSMNSLSYATNSGSISSSGGAVGGIVGYGPGRIDNCKNSGKVTSTYAMSSTYSTTAVGGVVGYLSNSDSRLSNSYNTGAVKATQGAAAGGIVGELHNSSYDEVTVEKCYNAGTVEANPTKTTFEDWFGGIAGYLYGSKSSYEDTTHIVDCFTLESCTIDDVAYGCDVMVMNDSTSAAGFTTKALKVTADELKGAGSVTIDDKSATTLWFLNSDTGSGSPVNAFVYDSASAPENNGFPMLAWEANGSGNETVAITVDVYPTDATFAFVDASGHKYTAFSKASDSESRVYNLPAGEYAWRAEAFNYLAESGTITVGSEASSVNVKLVAAPRFALTANVTTDDGAAFDGELTVLDAQGNKVELTNGAATVAAGSYSYVATMNGYLAKAGTFQVVDDDVSLDIELARETSWNGTMTEPSDKVYSEQGEYWDIKVYSPSELAWVANAINSNKGYVNAHVMLMNDIALNEAGSTEHEWTPIGSIGNGFCGVFDGAGHRVSGVYMADGSTATYKAFFGAVGADKVTSAIEIKNLVVDGSISSSMFGAGLVGCAANGVYDLAITNCGNEIDVTVKSTGMAGAAGILDFAMAVPGAEESANITITGCYNAGDLSISGESPASVMASYAGGIIGRDHMADNASAVVKVADCYNIGTVTATDKSAVAGIVACGNGGYSLAGCYNTAAVSAPEGSSIGSLAGDFVSEQIVATSASLWVEGTAAAAVGTDGAKDESSKVSSASDVKAASLGSAYKDPKVSTFNGGSALLSWQSEPSSIKGAAVEIPEVAYTGSVVAPVITVTDGETQLVQNVDYSVAYRNAAGEEVAADELVEAGTYTVIIGGIGAYADSVESTLSIYKSLTADMFDVETQVYTGEACKPAVSGSDGDKALVEGTDFKVAEYSDNVEPGIAKVSIEGAGLYKGSVTVEFEIASSYDDRSLAALVSSAAVLLDSAEVSADGTDIYTDQTWVTKQVHDELASAIEAVQNIIGSDKATQAEVQAAGDALQKAANDFAEAEQQGIKQRKDGAQWTRIGGTDRYDTAAKVSQAGFESSEIAIVASGEKAADALAASGFAGLLEAPVLMTASDELSASCSDELERLGVKTVYVMGGEAAVSDAAVESIEKLGIDTERVFGDTRVETAGAIYGKGATLDVAWGSTAIVVNGTRTPDALSIASYAYAAGLPVFMTGANGSIDEATLDLIAKGGFTRVVITGGIGVVDEGTENALKSMEGLNVVRLGGTDRYETSALVAQFALGEGMTLSHAGIATGVDRGFADALGAAALCGKSNSILVLAQDNGTDTEMADNAAIAKVISGNGADVVKGYLFGGTGTFSAFFFEQLYGLE